MNMPTETAPVLSEDLINALAKNWWMLLIRGILLILVGGYALSAPGLTLATYCWVMGIFLVVDSIFTLLAGVTHKMEHKSWVLARGVLTLLVGLFMVGNPLLFGGLVAITLVMILAIHSVVNGVLEIYVAVRDRKAIAGEGWMMLSGAFSVLFGMVLFSAPVLGAALFIRIIGAVAIFFGVAVVFSAFRFKALKAS